MIKSEGSKLNVLKGALAAVACAILLVGCSSDDPSLTPTPPASDAGPTNDAGSDANTPPPEPPPLDEACIPSVSEIQAWQEAIDQFDGGYRPTGSPAHEAYIDYLGQELSALGVSDIVAEPYKFAKWTPLNWSFSLLNGSSEGPVSVSGYVPYSGWTGPLGVQTGVVYLPNPAVEALTSLDATSLADALNNPDEWAETLQTDITASLSLLVGGVLGKIVVFEVPRVTLPASTLTGPPIHVNDPDSTLPSTVSSVEMSSMLYVPAVLNALFAAGAAGAVGILDSPEQAARGQYAPFFATVSMNMPAVYVDRATGAQLKQALDELGPFQLGELVLDATYEEATSENIVAVIPGVSDKEILLSSHTDGPNSLEDNGPVAILALASCFQKVPQAERPRTIRIVLTSGHFIASRGLFEYLLKHTDDLTKNALAVMELEHLGAQEWTEVSPGMMGLTGEVQPGILYTWLNQPLVDESTKFAKQFPRTTVAGPFPLGEGQNFRIVPLIQFLTMPEYLLVGHVPEITTQFTDYELMRKQITAFAKMEINLANAPADQLGVIP